MPDPSRSKTLLTIVIGFFVAIAPAVAGYYENKDEIAARYAQGNAESASGYAALAASVKELQAATQQQHDTIVKLESHLEAIEMVMQLELQQRFPGKHPASTKKPLAIPKPALHDLPADFSAAIQADEAR